MGTWSRNKQRVLVLSVECRATPEVNKKVFGMANKVKY